MTAEQIAIVLTGTIIPNADFTVYADPQIRRSEYLQAVRFYRQFAPVWFLENSSWDLLSDSEFTSIPDLRLRKFPLSRFPERGKGYQEFEMLDRWLACEAPPRRWIKVTGRYIYRNFEAVLNDCCNFSTARLLIDQQARAQVSRSAIFCIDTEFYQEYLRGLYQQCDDQSGAWIERVLYQRLLNCPASEVHMFSVEPWLAGISGSLGVSLERKLLRHRAKQLLRRINFAVDRSRIWYQ